MSYQFKCSACGADLQAEEAYAGQQTVCPYCSRTITIPPPVQMATAPVRPVMAQPGAAAYMAGGGMNPAAPRPANCGLATASLVLGILSIFFPLGILEVLAFIFGFAAMIIIGKSHGKRGGMGKAITGFVFGCLGIARGVVIFLLLMPAISKAREKSQAISCTNNLKMVALCAIMYANDNNGRLPKADAWEETFVKQHYATSDGKYFVCPSEEHPKYRFFSCSGSIDNVRNPSATILGVCETDHCGRTIAFFVDGHAESCDPAAVEKAIRNARPGSLPVLNTSSSW